MPALRAFFFPADGESQLVSTLSSCFSLAFLANSWLRRNDGTARIRAKRAAVTTRLCSSPAVYPSLVVKLSPPHAE